MRYRVLNIVAAACLAAACSGSSGTKPAASPISRTVAAQAQTTTVVPVASASATMDVNVGIMCSNLDAQIKDLADLVGKLSSGQSVSAFGIGIPIVGASDAARRLVLDHPGVGIDSDLTAFASALDGFDTSVIAPKPDSSAIATNMANVTGAWETLSQDCRTTGDYAFSNRLG